MRATVPIKYPEEVYMHNREKEIWNYITDFESEIYCYNFIKKRIKRKDSWKRSNLICKKKKAQKILKFSNLLEPQT
jgi:hypothetical protein